MKKLTKRSQMLVYAIGGMGVNMLNLMMGSYLLSAIIASGFGEEAIKNQTFSGPLGLSLDLVIAGAWAVLTVIAKVIDGVIDIPEVQIRPQASRAHHRSRSDGHRICSFHACDA